MTLKESATLLFEITHPEEATSFNALKEYLENMYFA
jgi:hypothetical protein|tara:strand:+ start:19098 stop:19205 length:108 start_codon:yes stop_codon:yes gene_type:complete